MNTELDFSPILDQFNALTDEEIAEMSEEEADAMLAECKKAIASARNRAMVEVYGPCPE